MKHIIGILIIALMLASCTDFIADVDRDDDWQLMVSEKVKLYYRESGKTDAPSPTRMEARAVLTNQNFYYQVIQDSINRNYQDQVLIYLYNKDEAKEVIGTSGGGHSLPRFLSIYYTFIWNIPAYTDHYGIEDPFLGAHEMVHVISHQLLGLPGTKMMSEGYAVWIDGSYARHDIAEIMVHYRDEKPESLMTPTQLLNESIDKESVYYPNAGMFTKYLVNNFGIERVNSLFTVSRDKFKMKFEEVTGTNWEDLEENYLTYLNNL
mgnify:CR=1 FL=1